MKIPAWRPTERPKLDYVLWMAAVLSVLEVVFLIFFGWTSSLAWIAAYFGAYVTLRVLLWKGLGQL